MQQRSGTPRDTGARGAAARMAAVRPRPSRRALAALAAALTVLAACGGDDDTSDDDAATTGVPPTAAATGDSPLCDAYLAFLAAPADQVVVAIDELAGSLGAGMPAAVVDALVVLGPTPPEGATADDFVAALGVVHDEVEPVCATRYRAAVVPAASDDAALTTFADALVSGDRAAAAVVAPADVIALFEPWQPYPADPAVGAPSYTVADDAVTLVLAATYTASCQASGGVVAACSFGE
jgi:hypothetical protein